MVKTITLSLVLLLSATNANAGLFGYETEEECRNKELQKYSNPTQAAERTVVAFCAEKFAEATIREIQKIKTVCNVDYDKARRAGYSHKEIVDGIRQSMPGCLR